MREEIDCGTCVYKCQKCTITFARAKDAIYHEKIVATVSAKPVTRRSQIN